MERGTRGFGEIVGAARSMESEQSDAMCSRFCFHVNRDVKPKACRDQFDQRNMSYTLCSACRGSLRGRIWVTSLKESARNIVSSILLSNMRNLNKGVWSTWDAIDDDPPGPEATGVRDEEDEVDWDNDIESV